MFKNKYNFMEIKTALTYDDVLLVPKRSEIKSRNDVNTTTKLSKNISLRLPLVSANMDTVTESEMAIKMALMGGIGIIHRFCSIDQQVKEVKKVKRKQNVIIEKPFTINPKETLKDLQEKIKEYNCSSFLVAEGNKLLGIITQRDFMYCTDEDTKIEKLMTPQEKLITVAEDFPLDKVNEILRKNKIEKLPLVNDNFEIKGLITAKDLLNDNGEFASRDDKGRLLVGAAIGVREDFMDRVEALVQAEVDVLVLDIAHGHSVNEIEALKKIKTKYSNIELICGNIATAEAAEDLIKAGADAVKVGIGPGSICTTRITTGFGVPQLQAIMDIYPVCKKYNIPMIADGGIKIPADLVKALVAGADSVMMGGQFSGTEETPGPVITYNGRQYKISRGMASLTAALSRPDAKEKIDQITPEGIEARVPYKGPVKNIVNKFIGGLKSGMSYGNARNIEELRDCKFIRITHSGIRESNSHDNEVL